MLGILVWAGGHHPVSASTQEPASTQERALRYSRAPRGQRPTASLRQNWVEAQLECPVCPGARGAFHICLCRSRPWRET